MFKDKEQFKEYKKDKFLDRRKYLNEYKSSRGCQLCGYNKHPQALCFDHIDPQTKHPKYNAKQLTRWGMDILSEELSKCRVLCHNCHAIHTFESDHYIVKR